MARLEVVPSGQRLTQRAEGHAHHHSLVLIVDMQRFDNAVHSGRDVETMLRLGQDTLGKATYEVRMYNDWRYGC